MERDSVKLQMMMSLLKNSSKITKLHQYQIKKE